MKTQKTILFADNQPKFVKVRKEFLEDRGFKVVAATSPSEAWKSVRHQRPDLAVIDIRLTDDDDENDISGIILAKEMDPAIPKIILTGFPTWELVNESLGPQVEGLPIAVDFISKREGPDVLLRAIEWHLNRPEFRINVLSVFEAPNLMALPQNIEDLNPEEASYRLYKSFEDTIKQLTQLRDQENRRASQYHAWGLGMSVTGMVLILMSVALTVFEELAPINLSLVSAAIVEAISALFFYQQNQAFKRVSFYVEKLNELNKLGKLLAICDSLASPEIREEYKQKIITTLLEKWFGN